MHMSTVYEIEAFVVAQCIIYKVMRVYELR